MGISETVFEIVQGAGVGDKMETCSVGSASDVDNGKGVMVDDLTSNQQVLFDDAQAAIKDPYLSDNERVQKMTTYLDLAPDLLSAIDLIKFSTTRKSSSPLKFRKRRVQTSKEYMTLLSLAAYYQRDSVVEFLLEKGADPLLMLEGTKLPLHHALERGNLVIPVLLLKHGREGQLRESRDYLKNAVADSGKNSVVKHLLVLGVTVDQATYDIAFSARNTTILSDLKQNLAVGVRLAQRYEQAGYHGRSRPLTPDELEAHHQRNSIFPAGYYI